MSDERHYDDEEFALILRRATELQKRSGSPGTAAEAEGRPGFTLKDIRQIASEAGIEPALIDQAASLVDARKREESGMTRLMGGPSRFFYEGAVSGEIREQDLGKLIDVIRRELAEQGEVAHVLNSLEWSARSDLGSIHMNVAPRDGNTSIQVSADRSSEAGLVVTLAPVMGLIIGMISAKGLDLGPGLEAILLTLSGGGGAYMAARATWSVLARRWRRRLNGALQALTRRAEELARRPGGLEPREPEPGAIQPGDIAPDDMELDDARPGGVTPA